MTSFRVEELPFSHGQAPAWTTVDPKYSNWPVVYVLNGTEDVYVGETLNLGARMRSHADSATKATLTGLRVVLDETFNKSVCLDLESMLIKLFAGDGVFEVLNRNEGITNADYYRRADYQKTFDEVFAELKSRGLFTRTIRQIENSDLFKLSPFKALNQDQAVAVTDIVEGLFADLSIGTDGTSVVQGDPGTGKTIVAIYLLKLLRDIELRNPHEDPDTDSMFSEFFTPGHAELLQGARIGFVVPQQSLRASIKRVFARTPGLSADMVLSAYDVGESAEDFDILVVDEAHRLNLRANQSTGVLNKKFADITTNMFGQDDLTKTQLDWIVAKSRIQILLFDPLQTVRPADLSKATVRAVVDAARQDGRYYRLVSQMRVEGGADYIEYVRGVLSPNPPTPRAFGSYDLRFFDDLTAMRDEILKLDAEVGLARIVAGFAWPWISRKEKSAHDIEVDGLSLRWNTTAQDWINAKGSVHEVGSIHTVQGYDLNYAGVIIGPDLRFDEVTQGIVLDRASYFDKKGKENNPKLGINVSDEALFSYVVNIYAVLLTRGIRGTFVYVCDPALRDHLRPYFRHQGATG